MPSNLDRDPFEHLGDQVLLSGLVEESGADQVVAAGTQALDGQPCPCGPTLGRVVEVSDLFGRERTVQLVFEEGLELVGGEGKFRPAQFDDVTVSAERCDGQWRLLTADDDEVECR